MEISFTNCLCEDFYFLFRWLFLESKDVPEDLLDGRLLVIVFDEVDRLNCHKDKERDVLRSLTRMLDWYSATHPTTVVGVYLSTVSGLSVLQPVMDTSSSRVPPRMPHPPVIHFPSLPILLPTVGNEASEIYPFCAGRPLWLGIVAQNKGKNISQVMLELVQFATIKLVPSGHTQTTSSLLALFYCRFCFGYISSSMGEALVRNHMATLVAVREDKYAAQYHVEPILAEASARYTTRATPTGEIDVFAKVVDSVAMHIREDKMVEASVGDCGELAGAVALAAAMDFIRTRGEYDARTHNMSRDVPLKVFLAALLGEDRLMRTTKQPPPSLTIGR